MIRGLYTSGWSMMSLNRKMDVISNNMANSDTNAFKKDMVVTQSFPELLAQSINYHNRSFVSPNTIGAMSFGNDIGEIVTDYSQGQLVKTDDRLEFVIKDVIENKGKAFFTVGKDVGDGNLELYYTKNGDFNINDQGYLVTSDGHYVMGQNGVILLGKDDFSLLEDGTLLVNGQLTDGLLIKQFENTESLRKYGEGLVQETEDTVELEFQGTVLQGYQERSNVNVIKEMVDMITVMRSYEANQKMIQIQDNTLDKAVNEVGALR